MIRTLLTLVVAAAASVAAAQPINPTGNVRPVTVNPACNGAPGCTEQSLSTILNGNGSTTQPLFPGFNFNVNTDQSPAGAWRTASSVGTLIPTLVVEFAGFANVNKFGMWFGTDASNLWHRDLFLGPATAGTLASIFIDNGRLRVGALDAADCGVEVNCNSTGWLDSRISTQFFGFYFQTGSGTRVYSLDALNSGGEARFLSFQAGSTTNWAFAYEDLPFASSDRDYNDMVVKVESIVAVPEPSTYALLLGGLALIGFMARRRKV
jgi:hypothetical protein